TRPSSCVTPEQAPGQMSSTIAVPAGVPSLDHSSLPCTPSSAANRKVVASWLAGSSSVDSGAKACSDRVPALVPSLRNSSTAVPLLASKTAPPQRRYERVSEGGQDATSRVPAALPSLDHKAPAQEVAALSALNSTRPPSSVNSCGLTPVPA